MKDDNLKKILELESKNRTLRAEIERLKISLFIYKESNFSTLDLGGELLNPFKNQAADSFDDSVKLKLDGEIDSSWPSMNIKGSESES